MAKKRWTENDCRTLENVAASIELVAEVTDANFVMTFGMDKEACLKNLAKTLREWAGIKRKGGE